MNVLVVGANGQIGKQLVDMLKEDEKYTPFAFVRKEEQVEEFASKGVEARLGNLEDSVDDIKTHMDGVDSVVFAAGSGGSTGFDKTLLIDLDGAIKVIEAAEEAGVDRFVMISALHSNRRETWSGSIKPYYVAKHYADRALQESDLTYTVVRPGGLLNELGTGNVDFSSKVMGESGSIPREDVARVVHYSLENENTYNKSFDLASGEDSIEEAINKL